MKEVFPLLLAIAAGTALPIQAALNAKMSQVVHNPYMSGFISFAVGAAGLFIYMLLNRMPLSNLAYTKNAAPYVWIAGFLGAFYVTTIIVVMPRLGLALTFGLIIAGQMVLSVLIDHFGLFGTTVHPISWMRLFGALLLVAGVIIIRKF